MHAFFTVLKNLDKAKKICMTLSAAHHVQVAGAIFGWYACSFVLVSCNKVIFDILDLPVPLLVTFVHFSITSFIMVLLRSKFPALVGQSVVSRSEFLRWILPIAICTAGDVGLSNMAYSRLPISVFTVLKSSAPVCIYGAAVVGGIEKFQWRVGLVCAVIAVSVACAMPTPALSASWEYFTGILIVLCAMICLSVRWVLIQTLSRRYTPSELMYFIQPTSALVLLPFALTFESSIGAVPWLAVALVCGSALAAMGLLFLEYRIVHYTTSLTLSIAGIGKEVLTLCLSFLIFSETFSIRQIFFVSISILGIIIYGILRKPVAVLASGKSSFVLAPKTDQTVFRRDVSEDSNMHLRSVSPARTVSLMEEPFE